MQKFSEITSDGKIQEGKELRGGIIIGKTAMNGQETVFWIGKEIRNRLMSLIGNDTEDRLNFLKQIMRQDIKNEETVCVIDTEGGLVQDALETMGKERAEDVIIFDPSDIDRPVGINILDEIFSQPERHRELSQLIAELFKESLDPLYHGEVGVDYLNNFSKYVRETLLDSGLSEVIREELPGCSLLELHLLLEPLILTKLFKENGEKITREEGIYLALDEYLSGQIKQPKMRIYWEFLRIIGELLTRKSIKKIIGVEKTSFDIKKVLTKGKVFIGDFSNSPPEYHSFLINVLLIKFLAAVDNISYIYINNFIRILPTLLKSFLGPKMILSGDYDVETKGDFPMNINLVYFDRDSRTAGKRMTGTQEVKSTPKGDFFLAIGAMKKQMTLLPLLPSKSSANEVKAIKQLVSLKYGQSAEVIERMLSLRAEKYLAQSRKRVEGEVPDAVLKTRMAFLLDDTNYRIPQKLSEILEEEGKKLLKGGQKEEAKGCFKLAIAVGKKSLSLYPRSANLHNHMGILYEYVRDFNNAIKHYQRAIEIDHEYRWAYVNLADVLYDNQDRYDEAIVVIKKALQINPEYTAALRRQSRRYLNRFPDKSKEMAYRALEKEPDNIYAHANLRDSLYSLAEYEDGIDWFKKRLKKDENYLYGYYGLGEGYEKTGKFEEAIDAYNKALRIAGEDDKWWLSQCIAITYRSKGKFGKALEWVQKGLESAPESKYLLSTRALTYLSDEEYEKALETWNGILKDDPPDDDWVNQNKEWIFGNIGFCYYKMGILKEAEKWARDALKIGKMGFSWPNFTLGFILLAEGKARLATHCFLKGIGLIASPMEVDENVKLRTLGVTRWLKEIIEESSDNREAEQILTLMRESGKKIKKKLPGYYLWQLEISEKKDKFSFKLFNRYLDIELSESLRIQGNICGQIEEAFDELYIRQSKNSTKYLEKAKEIGELIFNKALPQELGKYMMQIPGEYLEIITDKIDIPWELAFDGSKFLGFVHSIGRNSKMRSTTGSNIKKKVLKILTISDNEDLAKDINSLSPVESGGWHHVFFNSAKECDILTTTKFDIINFVGDVKKWLEDENLLPNLKDKTPHVLFIDTDNSVSIANSFRNIGVDVFIGRVGKASQSNFLLSFLKQLTMAMVEPYLGKQLTMAMVEPYLGTPISTVLKEAKILDCLQIDGNGTDWASYLLLGDPTFTISPQSSKRQGSLNDTADNFH